MDGAVSPLAMGRRASCGGPRALRPGMKKMVTGEREGGGAGSGVVARHNHLPSLVGFVVVDFFFRTDPLFSLRSCSRAMS